MLIEPRVGDLVEVRQDSTNVCCKARITEVLADMDFLVKGQGPVNKPFSMMFHPDGYSLGGFFTIINHWPENNLEDEKQKLLQPKAEVRNGL